MNKSYKIVWSESTQQWVVAGEFASGKKKTKTLRLSRAWQASLLLAGSMAANAWAADIDVTPYSPTSPMFGVFGSDNLIQGAGAGFAEWTGNDPGFKKISVKDAVAQGIITKGQEYADKFNIQFGNRSNTVTIVDPVTGNGQTVNVYDSDSMFEKSLAEYTFANHYDVGPDGQYLDKVIYDVTPGATLNVNVGAGQSDWVNDPANFVNIIMKSSNARDEITSAVYNVDSGGTLNYSGKTVVFLGNRENNGSTTERNVTGFQLPVGGTINTKIGSYTIDSVADVKAYNNALIKALQENRLAPADYEAEFNKALKYGSFSAVDKVSAGDPVTGVVDKNHVAYILADGPASKVNITEGANVQMFHSDASLIRAEHGAQVNNSGTIGSFYNNISGSSGSYIISADDATVHNMASGVIDAGTNQEVGESFVYQGKNQGAYFQSGRVTAIEAKNKTDVINDGVINVTSPHNYADQYGIHAINSTVTNNGAINVASNTQTAVVLGNNVNVGVGLTGEGASMVNNGTISIGRSAQRSLKDTSEDVAVGWSGIKGVSLSSYATFTNNGTITTGTQTHGVTAINVTSGASATQGEEGKIIINSAYFPKDNAPAQSVGIDVLPLGNADNSGTITLNGVNGVGLNVNREAQATNSGTIVVANGVDSKTHTANYGIQSQGVKAKAILTGNVDLTGDGAIGVYVKDGGTAEVDGGSVNFRNGVNQIGYVIHGADSSVTNSNSVQSVGTEGSTLYRISGGAGYAAAGGDLTASGTGSTILLVTGKSDDNTIASNVDTTGMTLTVSGQDATAVRVEGGAQATIDANTDIALTANGATAGVVRGGSTTVTGEDGPSGASELNSAAVLNGTNVATGALGYKVLSGGTLNHSGEIKLAADNSTGVEVDGGTLNNTTNIAVNGIAVDIIGGDSTVINTGDITATGGLAAFRLSNGASLDLTGSGTTHATGTAHGILLDKGAEKLTVTDATINMDPVSTGNAIENTAEIAGIHLDNTTINVHNGAGVRTAASLAQQNSGTINVNGSGTGLLFQNADGTTAENAYDMSQSQDLVINVNSADGKGMTTNTSGDIKSGVSINVNDARGGAALVIDGTTQNVEQSGNITSQSTTTQVVDLNNGSVINFINSGSISASSVDAVLLEITADNGLKDKRFYFDNKGALTGDVMLFAPSATVTLEHGSTAATDFITGDGNDVFSLKDITADENATLFDSLNGGGGNDTLLLRNSVYALSDAEKIQQMEMVSLNENSTFTLDNVLLDLSGDKSNYYIDDSSSLVINNREAVSFTHHLAGTGLVKVDLSSADNAFAFTENNAADGFKGTVALTNSSFLLDGTTTSNNQALTNATLILGDGNKTTVAKGTQQIGSLAFNGGTAIFTGETLGKTRSDSYIETTNNLDISGRGTVQVTTNPILNTQPLPENSLSLTEQDDARIALKLAGSTNTVSTYGGNLTLVDRDGKVITDAVTTSVEQGGTTVANATYDYRLTSGDKGDGLYVNYGLKQLELLTSGDEALALNAAGQSGAAADLSAQVTGSGDLAIDAGESNVLSLSNMDNDYTGVTDVRSGTLQMANDNVMGQTSELRQAANTTVDMNGHSQTVGQLNTGTGATTNLNGGSLTIADGGMVDGTLTGEGNLNLAGGSTTINGANAELAAMTTISSGAEAVLNDIAGLGTGAITDEGKLMLNGTQGALVNSLSGSGDVAVQQGSAVALTADNSSFAGNFGIEAGSQLMATEQANLGDATVTDNGLLTLTTDGNWDLANSITGSGDLNKEGSGHLTLNQEAAQYTGVTNVNAGVLQLGREGNDVTLASSTVNVAEGAQLGGFGGTAGDVNNAGILQVAPMATSSQTFTVAKNLTNSGTINVSQPGSDTVGNVLHVQGDYIGNGGTLNLNTKLGGDDSPTDKLVVDGNTSGTTAVAVTNVGGSGAETLNGIEVVSVGGDSSGEFTKKGRIIAGAYDYDLVKKGSNWYLTNSSETPVDPADGDGGDVTPDDGDTTPTDDHIRPEGKAYASNMRAANTLFNMTLHDRLGETHYVDAMGKDQVTSLWLRQVGGHNRSTDQGGYNKTQANRYVAQLGGDIAQWSSDGADRFHLGIMGGYANQHSNTRNSYNRYSADGSVDGYSVGLYGTWFQDSAEKTGAYVDTWMLYNWFDNTVSSKDGGSSSYDSKGITASVETGYTWKVGERSERESYYVQPQAQITWMGVKSDSLTESNGTRVEFDGDGNIQTRLGVRAFIKGNSELDNGKGRTFEPFVEANWIHNTHDFSAKLDGVRVREAGTRNIGELKVGVEAKLNNRVNLWGNVGQQIGDKGYSDTQAMLGLKVNF
jgi:autotransporter family porin